MASQRKLLTGGSLAVLAVLFVAVVLVCNVLLRGVRVDLTQHHLYTLSQGTKNILAGLDEPIHIYLYFSDRGSQDRPQLRTYAQRVREMLDEMSGRARGKLAVEVIDPLPFSEDEDRAQTYGVQAVPAGPNGANIYFGLVGTNSTNGQAVIPFLQADKEAFLEYDIAKLIQSLATPKRPVIGLLSGLPLSGGFDPMTRAMDEPWEVDTQLKQLFDVRPIDASSLKAIDADVTTLVVVHPKKLSDDAQYAIDQFVMRGGHLLAFVDPSAASDRSAAMPGNPAAGDSSSNMPELFKAWGIEYDPHEVVLDRANALQINMRGGQPVRHAGILGLGERNLNGDDVITANLGNINVATPGYLQRAKDAKYKLTPLLETSDDSMVVASERLRFLPDPTQLLSGYKPAGGRRIIAARLEGRFASAFPERKDANHIAQAKEEGEIVLVADTDLLSDPMWVQSQSFFGQRIASAFANNGDFFVNAVDNLTGSSDLISIRGRAVSRRPFTRVEDMKRAAENSFRDKELELEKELKDTERKLTELQTQKTAGNEAILSPAQQEELASFVKKRADIRKELRQVRRGLDEQIESLGRRIKLIDIGLMPAVVTAGALGFAAWKRRRRAA